MKTKYIILSLMVISLFLTSCWESKKEESWSWVTGTFVDVSNNWETENIEENNKEDKDKLNFEIEENNDKWLLERYINNKIWNLKCDFNMERWWWTAKGTMYISWLKMKYHYTVKYEGFSSETNMLYDWEYVYMWWPWMNIKMKMKKEDVVKDSIKKAEETNEDEKIFADLSFKEILEKNPYNKCSEWVVDENVFRAPKNIKFEDPNAKIKKLEQMQNINMDDPEKAIKELEKLMPEWANMPQL